jgi:hypothetical protein
MPTRPGSHIYTYINDSGPQGHSDGSNGASVQAFEKIGGVEVSGVGVGVSCRRPSAEAVLSKLKSEDELPPGRTDRVLAVPVHVGRQGKHLPGHNNFQPGGSVLLANPAVLDQKAGTGEQVGRVPLGESGSKERVLFDAEIGYYVDESGRRLPTRVGIVHYSRDGIHIVPARPK